MAVTTKKHNVDVYPGRNYPRKVTVKVLGVPIPFVDDGVTAMSVVADGVEYTAPYVTFNNVGEVMIALGLAPNLPEGKFVSRLIMYSPDFVAGKPLFSEKTSEKLFIDFAAPKVS